MLKFNGKTLLCFDLETTGDDVSKDNIIQIHMLKIYPKGEKEEKSWLLNPEIPIHPKATEAHGIRNEDVIGKPVFKDVAIQVHNFISGAGIVVTYNGNRFDIPILSRQLAQCGIDWALDDIDIVDVFGLVSRLNPRTLSAMYKKYTDMDLENAHDAGADTWATIRLLYSMYNVHPEIPDDPSELELFANNDKPILDISGFFTTNDEGKICFSTGKHKGEVVCLEHHRSYLDWMVNKGGFSKDTIKYANDFLNNKFHNSN